MTTRSCGRFTLKNVLEECEKFFRAADYTAGIMAGERLCLSFDGQHPFLMDVKIRIFGCDMGGSKQRMTFLEGVTGAYFRDCLETCPAEEKSEQGFWGVLGPPII